MMMRCFFSLLLLLVIVFCAISVKSITVQVEPRSTECYFVRAQLGEVIDLEYLVTRGGLLDVNVRITGPSGQRIHEALHFFQEGDDEGRQTIDAKEEGIYSICFDNEMSRWTAKVVAFDLTVGMVNKEEKLDSLKPLEKSIRLMRSELKKISREQKYMRTREQSHRNTQESTYNRVWWFSFMESIVLVGMSLFQIFYMKKWFKTDKTSV